MTASKQWIRARQERLAHLGLYQLRIDGIWGPGHEAAEEALLAKFENLHGIEPPPYPALPDAYRWLTQLPYMPLTVHEVLKLLGTKEIPGPQHSPIVLGWAAELGLKSYTSDETAWCGLLAAIVNKRAQKDITPVRNILGAREWLKFGIPVDRPGLGDTVVFWRGSRDGWQGHVGIYIGEDDLHYHVAGGNQSNQVNIMRMAKSRFLGARRPQYRNVPETVKPYRLAATGAVSTNEA